MQPLIQYTNGNLHTTIYEDGTRVRDFEGVPNPIYPESIDVKITNYCIGAPCIKHCHEKSNPKGKHADLTKLLEILSVLPAGKECALGGGDPLSHPDLIPFLQQLKNQGIISNLTINQVHLESNLELILRLIQEKLIYGVGISYSEAQYFPIIEKIINHTNHLVFHLIMGINRVEEINQLNTFCQQLNKPCKILILGYKQFGFGINYYLKNPKIEDNKYRWYVEVGQHLQQNNLVLSFDNLAIEQLKLQRFFTTDAWNQFYQGDDGTFTMYIDAVEQQFAKSSTSTQRTHFSQTNLLEYFKSL